MDGRCAATLAGRVDFSDMAGELLRVEPSAKDDESETRSRLLLWEDWTWPVDGRRDSALGAGEVDLVVGRVGARDNRDDWSMCLSLSKVANGGRASEAERCGGGSRMGELTVVARSMTFARPAATYDTLVAMSQLFALSKRAMLILLASKHSLSAP
jgi:hypothetical protein